VDPETRGEVTTSGLLLEAVSTNADSQQLARNGYPTGVKDLLFVGVNHSGESVLRAANPAAR
jgi:hypothetical protein